MTTSNNTINNIINMLIASKKSTFISVVYKNNASEISKYTLNINGNYLKAVYNDIVKLESEPINEYDAKNFIIAKNEIKKSLINTLYNHYMENRANDNYSKPNYYTQISKSIKVSDNDIYINSILISKKIIKPGEYKSVKHSEKTQLKNKIKKQLKTSKFREFKLNLDNLYSFSFNKQKFVIKNID